MRAIDLYSGVGGWTLGLEMAGIEVVRCYEWWNPALETYNANLTPVAVKQDIRELNPADIDVRDIDIVVGSPPCTQFSYSNRGGGGDLSDGLKDIKKFLEIVRHLKPKYWALENVPRVAHILRKEIEPGGQLEEFSDLVKVITVVDMSGFGLPQRRKRLIAGNFPIELLLSYQDQLPVRTLHHVISSLNRQKPVDPIYGGGTTSLTDTEHEQWLDEEECRLNQEAKCYHPVYNKMSFPDQLDRPSRTITALCTRVSRESIVVHDSQDSSNIRRLSVRERACLQGFPISYQFFGKSHPEKLKMVGNAIPPLMTFYIATAMTHVSANNLPSLSSINLPNQTPSQAAKVTPPNGTGRKFPTSRSFRAALKHLRFGSGMRFELKNDSNSPFWGVYFYYGNSKDIRKLELDSRLSSELRKTSFWKNLKKNEGRESPQLKKLLVSTDSQLLQLVWSRRAEGIGPFEVADLLGDWAKCITDSLREAKGTKEFVLNVANHDLNAPVGCFAKKLEKHSIEICAGLIVGSWFNTEGIQMLNPERSAA